MDEYPKVITAAGGVKVTVQNAAQEANWRRTPMVPAAPAGDDPVEVAASDDPPKAKKSSKKK